VKLLLNLKVFKMKDLNYLKKKNADYGNAFEDCGVIGILVRINDKIRRMQNISKTSITIIDSESLRDTLIDLQNYATLAILELDRK